MTDNSTLDFYNQHADAYLNQTRQVDMHVLYDVFEQLPAEIKMTQHILDIRCGSGLDSFCFQQH